MGPERAKVSEAAGDGQSEIGRGLIQIELRTDRAAGETGVLP